MVSKSSQSPRRRSYASISSRSTASSRSTTSLRSSSQSVHPPAGSKRTSQASIGSHSVGRTSSPLYGQAFWDSIQEGLHKAGYTLTTLAHGWVAPNVDCDGQTCDNVRKAVRRKEATLFVLRRLAKNRSVLKDEVFTPIQEEEVMRYLNEPSIRKHPYNHTVVMLDILALKSKLGVSRILVLEPSGISSDLYFKQDLCKTAQQWYHYIERVFEGFAFLHEHEIAFLDITLNNILINPTTLKVTLIDFETVVKGSGIYLPSPLRGTTPLEDDVKMLARLFLQHLAEMRERFPLPIFDEMLKSMFDNPNTAGSPHVAKMRLSSELKKLKRGLETVRSANQGTSKSRVS